MELKQLIGAEAATIDRSMRQDLEGLSGLDPLLQEILDYALFGGGKRIRPLLAILSGRVCGSGDAGIYRLAISFEYLHAATLLHDDVIDGADTRRGRQSVSRRYGLVGAILAGDFLHAQAMALVGRHGGQEGLAAFAQATRGMVDGEFVQLRNARNFNQSREDYLAVVMGKTALLIGAACEIGAIFAGGTTDQRQALRTYGINLGCAFQIVDDILDYLGDGDKTGKATGNDLAEGKMTLPLILALERAGTSDRDTLLSVLHDTRQRIDRFTEVRDLVAYYEGFREARTMARTMVEDAGEALDSFSRTVDSQSLAVLHGLRHYVIERQH